MRYIDFASFTPSPEWRAKSIAATTALRACTPAERINYIKNHSDVWSSLKGELQQHFGCRCWFTDVESTIAQLDVEHFRPKAKAVDKDGTEHEGYWWLAFELSNLRLAGQIPNRQHKKCYFPLLSPFRASTLNQRWQLERPLFLDPTRGTDVALVAYEESGKLRPSTEAVSAAEKERVEITDLLLGLSIHPPLVEARQSVWRECWGKIQEMKEVIREVTEHGESDRTAAIKDRLWADLYRMSRREKQLSSVARCCMKFSKESWLTAILES